MRIGDLAYIPSGVLLYKLDGNKIPIGWEKLHEPMRMLVCGEVDKFYKVLYQGSTWHAPKNTVTLLQRGENDSQASRSV